MSDRLTEIAGLVEAWRDEALRELTRLQREPGFIAGINGVDEARIIELSTDLLQARADLAACQRANERLQNER